MDEQTATAVSLALMQQSSVSSDSNPDEGGSRSRAPVPLDKRRICLVGSLDADPDLHSAARTFGIPVMSSPDGLEYARGWYNEVVFVVGKFEDEPFKTLFRAKQCIVGPTALRQLAHQNRELPDNIRPLYNLSMSGVVVCFTGFRCKDDLTRLIPLIHHMGGSIRKDMSGRVTHLIANVSGGEKYQYAVTFRLPVVHQTWVFESWCRRNDVAFEATADAFINQHKLKPFHGAKVCFLGFPEEEERHMKEVLLANGGLVSALDDAECSHVVMDSSERFTVEAASAPLLANIVAPLNAHHFLDIPSASHRMTTSSPTHDAAACFTPVRINPLLETVQEKSTDASPDRHDTTVIEADRRGSFLSRRKRKTNTTPETSFTIKRKRDLTYSETIKRTGSFFRTPLRYFSQRRRTIDPLSVSLNPDLTLNDSVASSSGLFNVDALNDLSRLSEISLTTATTPGGNAAAKKNFFARTFSHARFTAKRPKKAGGELDVTDRGLDGLNSSCFPDLPSLSLDCTESRLRWRADFAAGTSGTAVVDESSVAERPELAFKAQVVKAEWFWTSVQKQTCLEEKEYLYDDYVEQVLSPSARRDSHHHASTPSSASRRKRKRLQETLASLAQHNQTPSLHKRRSSVGDGGLLSISGSFLDCTPSPDKALSDVPEGAPAIEVPRKSTTARHQVFLELVQTETNYVNILHTITTMFMEHLEKMALEEALLNNTELKIIFGNLPDIYTTHKRMLGKLRELLVDWKEEASIGNTFVEFSTALLKAYPPFVNFFEEMKEMLIQCDANNPRFHAFLKACQTKPECGRQTLQDLMIRPVQRLPSISLLLNDILRHTPKTNPDHAQLVQALAAIKEIMTHINEDKRKTEGQRVMFDIFNDIDNCPADLISSHRSFVARCEVVQLSSAEGLSSKGNLLVLFLFTDQLEVCKKRSKSFKSPNTMNGYHQRSSFKPYKHIRLMPLSAIKRVLDIRETEDCQKVFSLVVKNNEWSKERLFSFAMTEEDADKTAFLKTLSRQLATNACTADSDKFLAYLEPQQLDIDTSDLNSGTLSKAFKFATRTKIKVGRAFSFNKSTPSKLKRAVSSMMSPFGSSTNLTPASQLAEMRLASCTNLNELASADDTTLNGDNTLSPVVAPPLSVQPSRKMKANSLGVAALKRL